MRARRRVREARARRCLRTAWEEQAQQGFHGYLAATIALYGPDEQKATKVAIGIILQEERGVEFLERWVSEDIDIRLNDSINQQRVEFLKNHGMQTVVTPDRIIGCPHEEGIDYPEGESCPQCPFWAKRDRWTGELIQ